MQHTPASPPRYAAATAYVGSVEHVADDRAWSEQLDDAWADPAWQVDSTTRPCCGGIGAHAGDCPSLAALAAIPAPTDARHVEEWRDDFGTSEYDRYFSGTRRNASGVTLTVTGFQAADGTARRNVHIFAADAHLDSAALRELAAQALAAADELDELGPIAYTLTDRIDA